jgi:hypothetical protein
MELSNTFMTTEMFFQGNKMNEIAIQQIMPIHQHIEDKLDGFLKTNKVPNLLFHGTSGCGKRTLVDRFISKIYNGDNRRIKQNVMNVNCAHGKGIKFIREDLKFFAKTNIKHVNGCNFKTIVLLNAGYLTTDAQSALRRCIESFTYNTRFFIIVENKHKLLYPILSRFCEIYVPEYIEDGKLINLHRRKTVMDQPRGSNDISILSIKIKELDKNTCTHTDLIELSDEIYNKGFSCLDLIEWFENCEELSTLEKSKSVIYFDKIRSEYRSEPFLMFTILDYVFLRENKDICF